jgi:hypothetical protein
MIKYLELALSQKHECYVGNLEKIIFGSFRQACTTSIQKIRSKEVPWITSEIKKLINTGDRLKRKAILTNLENDLLNFKTARNKVNIELRNAKKDYYSSKIAGQRFNPKKAWKSINNELIRQTKQTNCSK